MVLVLKEYVLVVVAMEAMEEALVVVENLEPVVLLVVEKSVLK